MVEDEEEEVFMACLGCYGALVPAVLYLTCHSTTRIMIHRLSLSRSLACRCFLIDMNVVSLKETRVVSQLHPDRQPYINQSIRAHSVCHTNTISSSIFFLAPSLQSMVV